MVLTLAAQILSDIAHHGIQIFQAPQYDREDDETIAENEEIMVGALTSFRRDLV
jgi:septin 7